VTPCSQLLQVALGERLAARGQVTQEAQHLIGALGHLGCQRQLGVVAEAQQLGQFLTQVEDLFHYRAVVELAGVRPLVGGTGGIGDVDLFAQLTIVGVSHHGVVAGEFQADQPAIQFLGFRRFGHLRLGRIGDAGQQAFVGNVLGPGLGRIEQLVGEGAAQLGELHADRAEALLLGRRQVDAGQAEVTQRVFDDGLLRYVEAFCLGVQRQRLIGGEQLGVLPQFGGVGGQLGQAGLVGAAQFSIVAHRIEVADRAPGAAEALVHFVQADHQGAPVEALGGAAEQFLQGDTVLAEDGINRRLDVLRTDLGIGRQVEIAQQRIGIGHGVCPF